MGSPIVDAPMGGHRRQEGKEMTFARLSSLRALVPVSLAALGCAAALGPCAIALASSSHGSHSGSHGSSQGHSRGSGGSGDHGTSGAPGGPRNLLTSADGTLNTAVGVYTDCSGASPVPATMAAVDTCIRGRTYFVGHNQGVFTPLMHMTVGSVLTWYDSHGGVHRYRVVAVRDAAGGARPLITSSHRVAAQFQTCALSDGSVDRILDAVAA